jgi:hypothetical protein
VGGRIMITRFIIEILIGFFAFIFILLLGTKGYVFLALLAITPVYMRLRKINTDEREYLLFYKAGNLSFGLTIVSLVLIDYFSQVYVNGNLIGNHWMPLSIASILFMHGLAGIFYFKAG